MNKKNKSIVLLMAIISPLLLIACKSEEEKKEEKKKEEISKVFTESILGTKECRKKYGRISVKTNECSAIVIVHNKQSRKLREIEEKYR